MLRRNLGCRILDLKATMKSSLLYFQVGGT